MRKSETNKHFAKVFRQVKLMIEVFNFCHFFSGNGVNEVNLNNSRDRDTRLRDAEKEPQQIQRLDAQLLS